MSFRISNRAVVASVTLLAAALALSFIWQKQQQSGSREDPNSYFRTVDEQMASNILARAELRNDDPADGLEFQSRVPVDLGRTEVEDLCLHVVLDFLEHYYLLNSDHQAEQHPLPRTFVTFETSYSAVNLEFPVENDIVRHFEDPSPELIESLRESGLPVYCGAERLANRERQIEETGHSRTLLICIAGIDRLENDRLAVCVQFDDVADGRGSIGSCLAIVDSRAESGPYQIEWHEYYCHAMYHLERGNQSRSH
ncbi:MAG: hypothetical protein R3F46_01640 [bacterium]